ncbi:tetratricopeptide repeat protein [Burkholderia sola]|uniref:tetratricopeptide repeat protein n=1 Tax=Burkholderia TaxID=32008 RepID=UPI001AE20692|nr:tetratricopeptide repeat protein [Burkholderia sp. AcTa6-5]MBP0714336.1 tetratricopeptide repeat protein [Burkholderia sp. AcTa6-5]
MGFISKVMELLGGSKKPVPAEIPPVSSPMQPEGGRTARNAVVRDDWLSLTKPDFFGQAHRSPGKRWIVGCNDSDGVSRGGYRESGNGWVVLVDHQMDKVVHELRCFARPTDAAVSDAGTYIVLDSGFGSALQGDVVALDLDGHERYRRHYRANVFNVGLSRCGRYAAVQTANAPNDDGNLLEVLDLDRGAAVFSVPPATGWADKYSFDVDAEGRLKAVGVEHKRLGRFSYSASGEFQDAQAFQAARLDKGDYATKIMSARDLLKTDATPDNARRALSTADAALAEGAKDTPDWASTAHRVRGEAYELLGQLPEALEAFDQALSLNPKVGVQKRAVALRKKLGTG